MPPTPRPPPQPPAAKVPAPSGGAPALKGDPYSPGAVDARVRPPYQSNPAHNPANPHSGKTPEPPDAAAVYEKSIRSGNTQTFYGIGQDGRIYRFFSDNAGSAHFSGFADPAKLPPETLRALGR